MTKVLSVLAAVAVLGATAASQAATIDFTSTTVGTAVGTGKTSVKIEDAAGTDVDVTIKASTSTNGKKATLTWQANDGLGIKSTQDTNNPGSYVTDDWETTKDEINGNEKLTIGFSEAVKIQSIGLTDLYDDPTSGAYGPKKTCWQWNFDIPGEAGKWTLTTIDPTTGKPVQVATGNFEGVDQRVDGGGSWAWGPTVTPSTNGVYTINLNDLIGSSIALVSTLQGSEANYKGFSVGSVTFSKVETVSVPELSASGMANAGFLLVGAAMLLTGAKRRKLA